MNLTLYISIYLNDVTFTKEDASDELCKEVCLKTLLLPKEKHIIRKCPQDPSVCLPVEQYCDGIAQCPDGGDEIQSGCTCEDWGLTSCKHGETQLPTNCINKDWASGAKNDSDYECQILRDK